MTEEWRDSEREERRQNDKVAIKYTAGSEEHAGCCWEAALWWRISAPSFLFLSILVPQLLDTVLSVALFFQSISFSRSSLDIPCSFLFSFPL